MQLSAFYRQQIITALQSEEFNVVVIGGGITGAGIALDASLRGLKTALIEKNDFAYGTSSRSTKLIHGGLRYLKQLEFGLVKEVGSERAIVHQLAPHLVIPEKMLLPLKEGRGFGSLLTSFGLKLYDWLAGVKSEDQRKMLTRKQTLEQEPLLNPEGIKGGGLYAEYRTDDARLTIEIIKTASAKGAYCLSYVCADQFEYDDRNQIKAVKVIDLLDQQRFSITARRIVNATGSWVDRLRETDGSLQGKKLHLTKGVHLVVARKKLPVRQAVYFDVNDGRMIFAIPRGFTTYIGTTDTDYQGSIDEVRTSRDDAKYLIDAVNDAFPSVNLSLSDIESSWAGLRPLIHEEGKSASELSRKDEIFQSSSGLLSIAGGKLTGYRKMAERVVDLVIERTFKNRNLKPCSTDKVSFTGGPFTSIHEVRSYIDNIAHKLRPVQMEYFSEYLVHTYGRQTEIILDLINDLESDNVSTRLARAELQYCIQQEMVFTACDFFIRRTGMLYFDINRLEQIKEVILKDMSAYFNWTSDRLKEEYNLLEKSIREARIKE
ncbi:MAG: glycerol-3-phosphate dehydrogenase/oxidase [Cyclobacteriaceae bacterium]|jgi:glycerol-3-phosphate dehydrogenase|nr:glycerol-3-phosphate dehydrogenase/oxidase [Cyclobacteriaceae bacterium]